MKYLAGYTSVKFAAKFTTLSFFMENHYVLLEVKPQATSEEIKAAYRSLCQEYHPDKLPPGTPEKARSYVQDRFKQINEAYSILSDREKRKDYDLSCSASATSFQESTATQSKIVFDPEKMKQATERLKILENKIETEYQESESEYQKIQKEVDRSIKHQLHILGYKEEELNGNTLSTKIVYCIFCLLVMSGGLLLMTSTTGFLWLLGIICLISFGFFFLIILATPILSKKDFQRIEKIKEEFEPAKEKATKDKQNAEKKRQRELNEILSHRRERINFFNSVPVQNLFEDYIALLTDEDQLYLLQSMQERKDAE